ncbi:hypothetical protein NIES4073_67410 [Kalymmatonema gypsitolerans NIES-4073]|nr:hypothetical protein NIES4073_67410 [Scytonema sp. NIES-4073]
MSFGHATRTGLVSPTRTEVASPVALLRDCPPLRQSLQRREPRQRAASAFARLRIFIAAFTSLCISHPQAHLWVRVERDFLTTAPQSEHF